MLLTWSLSVEGEVVVGGGVVVVVVGGGVVVVGGGEDEDMVKFPSLTSVTDALEVLVKRMR